MEELGYYISRGLLENGKALANLANLVLPAVLTACDLADEDINHLPQTLPKH